MDDQAHFSLKIINTRPEFAKDIVNVIALAFGFDPDEEDPGSFIDEAAVVEQIRRFPVGQFVALLDEGQGETVVGMSATMRLNTPP